ncbi:MAG TPA: hypothetical protein VNW95_03935 [Mucilaginibacter sp.]|jgi:hypothetical protein|nr:hypothetical protein [Mucilaginibacter sp.]
METKDWITIAAVIVAIVGWFINGGLNRRNEIAKKRLDYEFNALLLYLKVKLFIDNNPAPFSDPSFLPLLAETRLNFQLYCERNQITQFENFIQCIEQRDVNGANDAMVNLNHLVSKRIRRELNIRN